MLLEELRQKVVEYGNKLISSGLTIGTAGNISMYDPESGYMVISALCTDESGGCCCDGSSGKCG